MFDLFWSSFKRQLFRSVAVSILMVIGIIACIYSASVMMGTAMRTYKTATRSNTHATITLDAGRDAAGNVRGLSEYINGLWKNGTVNVLYFTKTDDGKYIIGWDGTKAATWFPVTTGRFFTDEEQMNGERVFFCSNGYRSEHIGESTAAIGEHSYDLVGEGWIVAHNFLTAIPSQSYGRKYLTIKQGSEEDGWIDGNPNIDVLIIPFKCYAEEFEPELVLIQFNEATHSELERLAKELNEKYTGSAAWATEKNSDDILEEEQLRYARYALVLCLIAGATLLRLMYEWVKRYYRELYVLHLCGLPKIKCSLILYGHWLIYFLAGSLIATGIHYLTLPLFKGIYADSMPVPVTFVIFCAVIFILSVLLTIPGTARVLKFENRRGGI